MLDQEQSDATGTKPFDHIDHRVRLPRHHAGGGLVQDEQPRLETERAGDFHPPLIAIGQFAGHAESVRADPHPVQQGLGVLHHHPAV